MKRSRGNAGPSDSKARTNDCDALPAAMKQPQREQTGDPLSVKQVQAKLGDGDPPELAEIVPASARRERTLTANGTNSKLSISEKGSA